MKNPIRALFISGILLSICFRANGEEEKQIMVEMDIFRILGNISGQTSLTDSVYEGLDSPTLEQKKRFSCWVLADQNMAGVQLKADENSWKWDGKEKLAETDRIRLMLSPRVIAKLGEKVSISLGSETPLQYFEKRDDGLYELKVKHEKIGMGVEFTPEAGENGRIVLRDLTFSFRTVEKREPIEEVLLEAGVPIVTRKDYKTSIALKSGRFYGLGLRSEGRGFYLVRIKVGTIEADVEESAKTESKKSAKEVKKGSGLDISIEKDSIVAFTDDAGLSRVSAKFRNNSSTRIPHLESAFYAGDPEKGGKLIGRGLIAMEPRETGGSAVRLGVDLEANEVFVVIDPNNKIKETNEENNKASRRIKAP